MPALASPRTGALLILVLLLAPIVAHLALMAHRGMALAGLLIAAQAAVVVWLALLSMVRPNCRAAACVGIFLSVILLSRAIQDGPVVVAAVPHAMAYLALLVLFASSLQPGREAIVTKLARRSRGRLPAEIVRYTRRVTWAWCWFFLAQLVGSLLLLLLASLDAWSMFINLCNVPLIALMLCAEYAYRQWRHAAQPPERLVDMVRIVRHLRAAPVRDDR